MTKNKGYSLIELILCLLLIICILNISIVYSQKIIDKLLVYQTKNRIINIIRKNQDIEFDLKNKRIIANNRIYTLEKRFSYSLSNGILHKKISFNDENYNSSFSIYIKTGDKILSSLVFSNNNPMKIYLIRD